MRETKNIKDPRDVSTVSKKDERFWEWYGLVLMENVSRQGWAWKDVENRRNKLFYECVSEGDEALALQVLVLRGNYYKKQWQKRKDAKEDGEDFKEKRGRKKIDDQEGEEFVALQEKIDIFGDMHKLCYKVRVANRIVEGPPGGEVVREWDKLSWCEFLQKAERAKIKDKKKRVTTSQYSMYEVPVDTFAV